MKIAVIQFPGSNCQRETKLAIERSGMMAEDFLWNQPRYELERFDGYVIVGGFSYEDRGRAGLIASLDPILTGLKEQTKKGKPLLGICNGAQILVEAGLVPGLPDYAKAIGLTTNKRIANGKVSGIGFYNDWCHIKPKTSNPYNAFTHAFNEGEVIQIPVAHAEGRFVLEQALYEQLLESDCAIFEYCSGQGEIDETFPTNPNGSLFNLAAIGNAQGNVLAMMPHPERTLAGDKVFLSMREYLEQIHRHPGEHRDAMFIQDPGEVDRRGASQWIPRSSRGMTELGCRGMTEGENDRNNGSLQLITKLTIHDNTAISINNALNQAGFDVVVNRYEYWRIDYAPNSSASSSSRLQEIIDSRELYNPQKQRLSDNLSLQSITEESQEVTSAGNDTCYLLVQEKENIIGEHKKSVLTRHFHIDGLEQIQQGTLWKIQSKIHSEVVLEQLLELGIFANPVVHECFVIHPHPNPPPSRGREQ